ncbi:endonuclease domain-containing protein [Kitasatospora sp. NPDC002965]|uniref:endonuclease domain-containing protein n=1 Tax=Kitasatospora sp. NPDC002965 TaxID=3154775 RepID=UPI0033AB0678
MDYRKMSPEAKATFLAERPGCELCERPSAQVDHDHVSWEVRGALCRRCNSRLGSLEAALRLPAGLFQSLAGDLQRALWRSGMVELERYGEDFAYLGLTVGEFAGRLRAVHEQLVLPYVYWAPVTEDPTIRTRTWTKIGPLCDDAEAERHRARLVAGSVQLWVWVTREPDDGVNSPAPRALVVAADSTEGARELHQQLRGPVDMSRHETRDRDFAELVVPVLMSRPLTAEQFRGAHWRDDKQVPATDQELRELLLRYGYMAGWLDLAVRIVLKDLAGDVPNRSWVVFSRARWHWIALLEHWRDRREAIGLTPEG